MLMNNDPDKEDKFPFDDITDFNKINPYKIFYDFYDSKNSIFLFNPSNLVLSKGEFLKNFLSSSASI